MDIRGHTTLPFPRQKVWEHLHDPKVLEKSVPGCESLQAVSPEKFEASLTTRVGPIKARFEGDAVITEAHPHESFTLTASGKGGMAGFANAVITIKLREEAEDAGHTRIDYAVDAKLGGKLAQLGSRLIESTARDWAETFFARFSSVMVGEKQPGTKVPGEPEAPRPRPKRSPFLARLRASIERRRQARRVRRAQEPQEIQETRAAPASRPARVPASGYIDIEVGNAVAEIRLNRPEKKNCVTLAMWLELAQAFNDLGYKDEVRCIVLTGAGGHFSSGADKSEFPEVRSTPQQIAAYASAVDGASQAILNCPKPVVAAIEGYCVGGGLGLAMACDFRLAKAGSQYFIPAAKLGLVYGERATHTLLALVGVTHAKRILFAGERMDANQAKAIGLIDEVVEADAYLEYIEHLEQFVGQLTDASPRSIAGSKAMLHRLIGLTPSDETRAL